MLLRCSVLLLFAITACNEAEDDDATSPDAPIACDEEYTKIVSDSNGTVYTEHVTYAILEYTRDPERLNHYLLTSCDCIGSACPQALDTCAPPYTCVTTGDVLPEPTCYQKTPNFYVGVGVAAECSYKIEYANSTYDSALVWREVYALKVPETAHRVRHIR